MGLPTNWRACQLGGLANLVRLPTWWACQLGNLVSATWWAGCHRATQQPAQLVIACATCHRLPGTLSNTLPSLLHWHTPPHTLTPPTTLPRHTLPGTLPRHTRSLRHCPAAGPPLDYIPTAGPLPGCLSKPGHCRTTAFQLGHCLPPRLPRQCPHHHRTTDCLRMPVQPSHCRATASPQPSSRATVLSSLPPRHCRATTTSDASPLPPHSCPS